MSLKIIKSKKAYPLRGNELNHGTIYEGDDGELYVGARIEEFATLQAISLTEDDTYITDGPEEDGALPLMFREITGTLEWRDATT